MDQSIIDQKRAGATQYVRLKSQLTPTELHLNCTMGRWLITNHPLYQEAAMRSGIVPRTVGGAITLTVNTAGATVPAPSSIPSGEMVGSTVDHRASVMAYSKLKVPVESTKRYSMMLNAAKSLSELSKGDAHLTRVTMMGLAELENRVKELQSSSSHVSCTVGEEVSIQEQVAVSFLPPIGATSRATTALSEDKNHSNLAVGRDNNQSNSRLKRKSGNCSACLANGEIRTDHRGNSPTCPFFKSNKIKKLS